MFPRFNTIARSFFVLIFVAILILTGILNMGKSSFSQHHSDYLTSGGHSLLIHSLSEKFNSGTGLRQLHSAFGGPQSILMNATEDSVSEIFFIHDVGNRLDMAGLRAIREMRMAETPIKVKAPIPPVNSHDFHYIHNPSQICAKKPYLSFLIYVHSAPGNLKRRQAIRQTWGNSILLSLFNASMIFAIGSPSVETVQKTLDMEFEEYKDLLQEDYKDTYRNLTYKGISVLKWAYKFCRQPLFFIKTDDDILLDIVSIVDFLLTKIVPARGARKLVMCNLWTTMKVIRDPKSKWGLSKEEFPNDIFPPYCSGSAFILSGDLIPLMYDKALRSPFFWVDDYFITGVLINKLGIKHERFNTAYLLNGLKVEESLLKDSKKYMVFHIKNYPLFFRAWHLLIKRHAGMNSFLHKYSMLDTSEFRKRIRKVIIRSFANKTSSLSSPPATSLLSRPSSPAFITTRQNHTHPTKPSSETKPSSVRHPSARG